MRIIHTAILQFIVLLISAGANAVPKIYWIDYATNKLNYFDGTTVVSTDRYTNFLTSDIGQTGSKIYLSNLSGGASAGISSHTKNLAYTGAVFGSVGTVTGSGYLYSFEFLSDPNSLFISDSTALYSCNKSGSTFLPSTLFDHADGIRFARSIEIDEDNNKIYWVDSGNSQLTGTAQNYIYRANLDGTNKETLTAVGSVRHIKLDLINEKLYWADNTYLSSIKRSNLDGTNVQTIISEDGFITGLGIDPTEEKLYWLDLDGGKIRRSSLTGSMPTDVVTNIFYGGALLVIDDRCPSDLVKIEPGICGCGIEDSTTDSDTDGTYDCLDGCPADPAKTSAGTCGCGIADSDTDGDGTLNCVDNCPNDSVKTSPGICGCGTSDGNSDGDALIDCLDSCPQDGNKTAPGVCGCGLFDITNQKGEIVCEADPIFAPSDPLPAPEANQSGNKIVVELPEYSGVGSKTGKKIKGAKVEYIVTIKKIGAKKTIKVSKKPNLAFKNLNDGSYEIYYRVRVIKDSQVISKSKVSPKIDLTFSSQKGVNSNSGKK